MKRFEEVLSDALSVYASLRSLEAPLGHASGICVRALADGHKLLICGNGGSATEAQHLAGELMGRYKHDRRALPAIALSADAAILTCIGNDYKYEDVFSRKVRGLGVPGDVLIVFTSSGNSPNVLAALAAARECGVASIAFLGRDGGKAAGLSDCELIVPHPDTARIQEGHQFLMHCLMDAIEAGIAR